MSITITAATRVIEPGGVIQTPFSLKDAPASETDPTVVFTLDDANLAILRGGLTGPVAVIHYDAAELRSQYTDLELIAALQSPKA